MLPTACSAGYAPLHPSRFGRPLETSARQAWDHLTAEILVEVEVAKHDRQMSKSNKSPFAKFGSTATRGGLLGIFVWLIVVVPVGAAEVWPDISSVPADLMVPSLTEAAPGSGLRVKQTLPAWRETAVYHVLYLPEDWDRSRRYPVLVEYAGNGGYRNEFGDVSTGRPEGSRLGYGMSAGRGLIWLCLPYLNNAGDALALEWWGDPPSYDPEPTLKYCREAVARVCLDYGGDAQRVVLCGFSRGAIACNFLGLHDDNLAKLWCGFVAYSHYDGVRTEWPYPGADRGSALARLRRLGSRPQFICQEGFGVEATRRYLAEAMPGGHFTFVPTGFRNHNDGWALHPSAARTELRRWLDKLVSP